MSEAAVRARIKTRIETVDNIGVLYDHEPFAATWDEYIGQFKCYILGREQIRGFTITCDVLPRERLTMGGYNQARYNYTINGYCGISTDSDTENEFFGVANSVASSLNTGIVSGNVYSAPPAQIAAYVPRIFGGVLCHYAEITQEVIEVLV